MPMIDLTSAPRCRLRCSALAHALAMTACRLIGLLPFAAAAADDPCSVLESWLKTTGMETAGYKQAKQEAEKKQASAPDPIRFAINERVKEPSPFRAEPSSQTWPGRGTAWVMFEGKRIAEIKDADAGKLCVKVYDRARFDEPRELMVKQAFLDTTTNNVKRLKVVFELPSAPSDLYSGVDFLFVGVLADAASPTFFSYFKEVTVANNRTATVLSWLFIIVAYAFLAVATYKPDDAGELRGLEWF